MGSILWLCSWTTHLWIAGISSPFLRALNTTLHKERLLVLHIQTEVTQRGRVYLEDKIHCKEIDKSNGILYKYIAWYDEKKIYIIGSLLWQYKIDRKGPTIKVCLLINHLSVTLNLVFPLPATSVDPCKSPDRGLMTPRGKLNPTHSWSRQCNQLLLKTALTCTGLSCGTKYNQNTFPYSNADFETCGIEFC